MNAKQTATIGILKELTVAHEAAVRAAELAYATPEVGFRAIAASLHHTAHAIATKAQSLAERAGLEDAWRLTDGVMAATERRIKIADSLR